MIDRVQQLTNELALMAESGNADIEKAQRAINEAQQQFSATVMAWQSKLDIQRGRILECQDALANDGRDDWHNQINGRVHDENAALSVLPAPRAQDSAAQQKEA